MNLFELNQYRLLCSMTPEAWVRSWLLGLLLFILFGCDQRFGTERQPAASVRVEAAEVSVLLTERESRSLDTHGVIQYLKLHEQTQWSQISEEEINDWVVKFDQHPEVLELISDYYLNQENLDLAYLYNSMAETYGAKSADFYKKRAKIHAAMEKYGLAIDYINKAVMINGSDPDVYLSKGDIYLSLKDSASALSYREQAFAQDSSRLDIAKDLAYLFAGASKEARSHELASWLIGQDYEVNDMVDLKATLYRKSGQHALANLLLKTLLDSGYTTAGHALVKHFRQINQHDSIIYYATKVLQQDTINLSAMGAKAYSFDAKGYFSSALIYYNQMLNIDSLNEEALEGIRKVNGKIAYLRKLREQREAIPTFDFAAPKNETN